MLILQRKVGTGAVGGTYSLRYTLDNPNDYGTSHNDNFGEAISINDSYVVVGTWQEDYSGGTSSGRVYVFNSSTGTLLHTLDNPNDYGTPANDSFGNSVGVSDLYIIAGAETEDYSGGTNSGRAYIYNAATGALLHTLDNPNAYGTPDQDGFGYSVDISDSYAIASAYQEDDAGGLGSGKAYIFNSATGALLHTLNNPNPYGTSANDGFGVRVAISGSYAIVGAYAEDDASGNTSGKAYIYNAATGALLHTLNNPNPYGTSDNDFFGFFVAISDSYAIVSAMNEDEVSGNNSGKAYIFDNATGALLHTLNNPNPYGTVTSDYFGRQIAISDSYAIVGAYAEEDDAGASSSGRAYVFDVVTGSLLHTLDNPNVYGTPDNDNFGYTVGISDSYIAVSTVGEDDVGGSNSGRVHIFNL